MILLLLLSATALIVPLTMGAARYIGRQAGWIAALGLVAVGTALLVTTSRVLDGGEPFTYDLPWIPAFDVALRLRLDGLSLLFAFLVLFVGALVMAYSASYLGSARQSGFYGWMTLFAAAMFGLVLADDLILFYVFWELTTVCSFFLINRASVTATPSAVRTLLITGMGGLSLLFGIILTVVFTGTTQLSVALAHDVWSDNSALTATVAVFVAIGAMTKSAQFPFHLWLPDAMVAPAPVSAYLHAAALVKAGIYLLMRFSPVFADVAIWQILLTGSGLFTAIMGAVFALQRRDLKEVLAYSTVSQLGLLVAAIGIGTPAALAAAGVHTLAHGLFKATLFMAVGIIERQAGTRDLRELGGLLRVMPTTAIATTLAALSMAGVPPLLGFIGKEYLFAGFLGASDPEWLGPVTVGLAVVASILTFAYSGKLVLGTFWGDDNGEASSDAAPAFLLPIVVPAVAGLAIGMFPGLLNGLVTAATAGLYEASFALWHGVTTELILSGTVVGVGVVLLLARRPLDRLLDRPLFPFTGVAAIEGVRAGTIRLGELIGGLTRTYSPSLHLALPASMFVALALGALFVADVQLPAYPEPVTRTADWLYVGFLALAVAGAIMVSSRLAGLGLVGVAGFMVGIWFFVLGAPDVGITQLLIEILTIVVLHLILRKLPRDFHAVSRARNAFAGTVALLVGGVAFLGTYALTGRREISSPAQYFFDNTYEDTGGTNIVNTILVDYRALDTLGELTVLAVAALTIIAVADSANLLPDRTLLDMRRYVSNPLWSSRDNGVLARTVTRWLLPAIVVLSLYLLLRGHYEPGGGFISALIAGAGFSLAYLTAPSDQEAPIRWPYIPIIGGAILLSVVTGLFGFLDGSFLSPIPVVEIPLPFGESYNITSALIFDLGVYLAVLGIILVALNRLGGVVQPRVTADETTGPIPSDEAPQQLQEDV